jgi:hypothetical protein
MFTMFVFFKETCVPLLRNTDVYTATVLARNCVNTFSRVFRDFASIYSEIVRLVLSAALAPRREPLDPVLEICHEIGIVTFPEGWAIVVLLVGVESFIVIDVV